MGFALRFWIICMSFLFIIFLIPYACSDYVTSVGFVPVDLNFTGTVYDHELVWKARYTGTYDEFGSVVIENGIGYVVGKASSGYEGSENITAFNATTGALIWTTNIGDSDGTPLLDNQGYYVYINVYNSGAQNGIYKLNKTNGSIVCENHACGTAQSMTQSNDIIFDGCFDSVYFKAYNKNDCSTNWTYSITGAATTPFYWQGRVVFGGYSGSPALYQLNATNGSHIWNSSDLGTNFWDAQPSIKDGILYMSSRPGSGTVTGAFNFTTGELVWNRSLLGARTQHTIYDNRLWIGSNAVMYSLNLTNGSTICSYDTESGAIFQGPSIVKDLVFFGSTSSDKLYLINATNCSLIWDYNIGESVFSAPAIAKGMLYSATDDWNVYAFDIGNGTSEWSYLGYNETGQSYCYDCLTTWHYVKSVCSNSTGTNITCNITSYYDPAVNVTLDAFYTGDWYNSSGLAKSGSNYYNLTNLGLSNSVSLTIDFYANPGNTTCGYLNTANKVYTLQNNLVPYTSQDCLIVNATNVTIDCAGYWIRNTNLLKAGIYSDKANTTVKNCNITMSSASSGAGIKMINVSGVWILNNTLNSNYDGIYLRKDYYYNELVNVKIENNTLNSNYLGVNLDRVSNATIKGNVITSSTYQGVYVFVGSNNFFQGNTISSSTDSGILLSSGTNNTLQDNIINSNGANGGIHMGSASSRIQNNTLNSNIIGIYVDGHSNTFIDNNIWTCTSTSKGCIYVDGKDNNRFSGGLVNKSSKHLIYLASGSDNNVFLDMKLLGATNFDVYLLGTSVNNTLINVTYTGTENVSVGGNLTRKWYYRAYVNDTNGNNVSNANVTAYNVFGARQFNLTTGSDGYTAQTEIVEFVHNSTKVYYSNYTIYAKNDSYSQASHAYNVTQQTNNLKDVFTLPALNTAPNDPSPIIASVDGTNSTSTDLNCSATISDPDADKMNVTVRWHKDSLLNFTIEYNSSYLDGTSFSAILDSGNTSVNDIWKCGMILYDGTAYSNWVNSSNLTIVDTTLPVIIITLPTNSSTYTQTNLSLNWTYTEINPSSCWYELNTNGTNITLTCGQNATFIGIGGILNNLTLYMNDSASNENLTRVYFTIDATAPTIAYTIPTPSNNTYTASTSILINATIADAYPANLTFVLVNSTAEINRTSLTTLTSSNYSLNFTSLTEDTYKYNVTATDTAGNKAFTLTRILTVDTTNPLTDYTSPTAENNSFRAIDYIAVNITITETNFNRTTFYLYNSAGSQLNATEVTSKTSTLLNFTSLSDGVYTHNVTVEDKVGNTNTTSPRKITIDKTSPSSVTITVPSTDIIFGNSGTLSCSSSDATSGVNDTVITVKGPGADTTVRKTIRATSGTITTGGGKDITSVGTYKVDCIVKDKAGNSASASQKEFTVTSAASGGGGGGSGGARGKERTYDWGILKAIKKTQQMANNDKATFTLLNISHKITIINVGNDSVKIRIESTPIEITLLIGQEKKIDFEYDGIYDILIKLNNIINNKADLSAKAISESYTYIKEEIPEEGQEEQTPEEIQIIKQQDKYKSWIIVAIIIFIVLAAVFLKKKRKKKKKISVYSAILL